MSSFSRTICWGVRRAWIHVSHKFTVYHLSRCHRRVYEHRYRIVLTLLSNNRHEPVLKRLTNYVGSNVNNFLYHQMFKQYWMCASPTNDYSCLKLTIGHMTILQYQFAHIINSFRPTTDFERPSRNSSWSNLRPRLNSPYHRYTLVFDGALLPKI